MKLRFDASLTLLYRELPLLERFARARASGFQAVELQELGGEPPPRLAEAARSAGVEVVLINAPLGDAPRGGPGLSGVPGREAEFRGAMLEAAESARTLGCRLIHVGPCRVPPGVTRAEALAVLQDNLRWAGDALGRQGALALLEAINPYDVPGVLVDRVEVALEAVERAGHPHVRLLFDAYHVARTDDDPVRWLARCAPWIAHVQVADAPGRGAPGTGGIDFEAFYAALEREGYGGWVGAEYVPAEPSHATLARVAGPRAPAQPV